MSVFGSPDTYVLKQGHSGLTMGKLKDGYNWSFSRISRKTKMEGPATLDIFVKLNESSSNWGQSAINNIMNKPAFLPESESAEDDVELEMPESDEEISVDEQSPNNGKHVYFDHKIRTGLHCLSAWLKKPQLLLPEEWKVCITMPSVFMTR